MEEIDVCWRLKNLGYKIYYNSNSVVYHLGGGTLSNINPKKTYLNFRNNLYLLTKNYNQGNFFIKLIYRMSLDAAAFGKFLFDGHPRHSLAVLHAHFSFYRRFKRFYRKRIDIQKNIKQKHVSGIFTKSVVFSYFLSDKKKFSDLKERDFTK
jgi:GT2 family glycosyltransferase